MIQPQSAISSPPSPLEQLLSKAQTAEAAYDHETAVALYTEALALPELTLDERYQVLASRAKTYWRWGHSVQAEDDWLDMVALARETGDPAFLAETIMATSGEYPVAADLSREALSIASDLEDRRLLAKAKMMVARSDNFQDWSMAHEALNLARELGDRELIFLFTKQMLTWSRFGAETGRPDSEKLLGEVARMANESGSLVEQTDSLKLSAWHEIDLARALANVRQAFAGYQTINNQFEIDRMANSIATRLLKLGLYRRALDYARQAVEGSRRRDDSGWAANCLGSVGRAYLGMGLLDEAQKAFEEGESLPPITEGFRLEHVYGLGLIALERGQLDNAIAYLEEVASAGDPDMKPHARADLALAYLSEGDLASARRHSHEAVFILDPDTDGIEYPAQNVWWRRYQVLAAAGAQGAFEALDQAQQAMFKAIETLRDEGMRCNYLNKVAINRDITLAWTAAAASRGLPLDPFTAHEPLPGNLREQFRRVVEIGGRMSAHHDIDRVADFIVDEFVEMSGAERVLLLLLDDQSGVQTAASFNPQDAVDLALSLLEMVSHSRQPLLRQDVGSVPDGAVPELHQRSLVALPLVAQGRFLGMLYGDMRQIFGRFDENDLHLLSMLANQAAAALENAELVSTLEEKVEERTAELAARNSELAIINSVQAALAAELDLQTIFEIVGERLSEIYPDEAVSVYTYDAQTDLAHARYVVEGGVRKSPEPFHPGPIGRHTISTGKALLLRNKGEFERLGAITVEGTAPSLSGMYVPLVIGGRFVAQINIENSARESAYDEADLRLLLTLANSMAVALENARHFAETQHLLAETEARKNELAIINSVQEGLAAELDLPSIFEIVGEKLHEIYPDDFVGLATYDENSDLMSFPYMLEHGVRVTSDPLPPGPISRHLLETQSPLLFGSMDEIQAFGLVLIPGTDSTESGMYVPLIIRDHVFGFVSIESGDRQFAYDAADLRLLTTLANSMSVALENARLFDETQQRSSELAMINSVQEGLAAELDLQAIFEIVGEKLREIYPEDGIAITTYDDHSDLAHYPYTFENGQRLYLAPSKRGELGRYVERTGQPVLMHEAAEHTVPGSQVAKSGMGVPLTAGERFLGMLSVYNLESERAYSESDLRLLATLAGSMSVALENARLFNETQRRAREMASLAEVGRDISATLDLGTVLERIAGHALDLLNVSDSALFVPDSTGGTMRSFVALGDVAEQVKASVIVLGQGLLGDVWQRRAAEIINNANEDPRSQQIAGTPDRPDERMMVAPLLSGDEVMGLLVGWRSGEPFQAADLQFLEGLARQAAIAIQNARLYSAAEAARADAIRANESKSTFLANMSHELRTPLNAIIGFNRIVKRKTEALIPDRQAENLDKVQQSAEHLLNLINTILDIAKIEAGRMDVTNSRFQVGSLIELCATTAQPLLKTGVNLRLAIQPDLPAIETDQDKLKQILLNLLSNAAKFTHQGSITIAARSAAVPDAAASDVPQADQPWLVIDVHDSGIGMNEEQLGRVFEEFQQADASTTRQYGGTGLGLAISRQLARLLGGDLTAESRPDEGSTFTLMIPYRKNNQPQPVDTNEQSV